MEVITRLISSKVVTLPEVYVTGVQSASLADVLCDFFQFWIELGNIICVSGIILIRSFTFYLVLGQKSYTELMMEGLHRPDDGVSTLVSD